MTPVWIPLPSLDLVVVVLLSLLLSVAGLTVGYSLYAARHARIRAAVKPEIRSRLLERLDEPNPAWESWVAELDGYERDVLRDLLKDYLQQLRGAERERLERLGQAMELDRWARRELASGTRHRQLQGLTWLILLEAQVDVDRLSDECTDDPDVRAACARVLHVNDHPDAITRGTDMLLTPPTPLSVPGLDTLYQLNKSDPTPVIERGRDEHDAWPVSLVVQVLQVIGECGFVGPDVSLAWIVELQDHDSDAVRAAVAQALGDYGWRSEVADEFDLDDAVGDPSPNVRRAVYRMLGEWDNELARRRLATAVTTDEDPRARLVAAEELSRTLPDSASPPRPGRTTAESVRDVPAWQWVRANERIGNA